MSMTTEEIEQIHTNINKLMAETMKLNAEAGKLNAERGKLTREAFWYPVAVASGMIGAVAAITGVLTTLAIKFFT